ncbi:hypothetical protein RKD30_001541 [Streptomyces pristinaespiralis]
MTVDLDGVLVVAHSDKEDAAPTWKRTYGHHPLMGFVDHGPGGTGEPVAALLRPGNAGSNTADDHVTTTQLALAQLPKEYRRGRRTLIRTDSAGGTHTFVAWLAQRGRWLSYSVGMTVTEQIHSHVLKVPASAWTPAVETGGGIRDGAWVAELTGDVLTGWPKGMRLIVRKERPHPGAQLRITDADGLRLTCFATNTTNLPIAERRRDSGPPPAHPQSTARNGPPTPSADRHETSRLDHLVIRPVQKRFEGFLVLFQLRKVLVGIEVPALICLGHHLHEFLAVRNRLGQHFSGFCRADQARRRLCLHQLVDCRDVVVVVLFLNFHLAQEVHHAIDLSFEGLRARPHLCIRVPSDVGLPGVFRRILHSLRLDEDQDAAHQADHSPDQGTAQGGKSSVLPRRSPVARASLLIWHGAMCTSECESQPPGRAVTLLGLWVIL